MSRNGQHPISEAKNVTVSQPGASRMAASPARRIRRLQVAALSIHVILLTAWPAGGAAAFHEQGAGACGVCHIMHASEDGVPQGPVVEPLLRYEATDLCLSCHAGANGSVLGSDPLNPPPELGGGNFTFLYEDNINDGPDSGTNPINGNRAGHNIVSLAHGIPEDPDFPLSPGGNFPSKDLGCTSCHDPHGNTNFRMLRGQGSVTPNGHQFLHPAPQGDGVDLSGGPESPTNHTAYQDGWTNWCANCHGHYHGAMHAFRHPTSQGLTMETRDSYNTYDGPTNPEGGTFETAYLPEVPIEDESIGVTTTFGASPGTRLNCMSCHRAHATSAPGALRWDPNVLRIGLDGGASGSYPIPNPYGDRDQRALCVKCHWSEASMHGMDQPCMECHGEHR
jgi:predicted CXXCH cytochrome family protein